MVNFTAFVSGILAAISLVLVAISLATSFWVRVDSPRIVDDDLNPVLSNAELRPLIVRYDVEHFGLWVVCYKEQDGGEVSCGYPNALQIYAGDGQVVGKTIERPAWMVGSVLSGIARHIRLSEQ